MRVSAMYYRKPKILLSLFFLVGFTAAAAAVADSSTDDGSMYFKGPMATCLSRAKVVFPCVSLSPPAYQTNSMFVTDIPIGANLPLNAEKHEGGWLARLKEGDFWSAEGLFSGEPGMDMNFSLDHAGQGMNMNLGPMKLNMYVDEANFSDTQFILGIDQSW